MTQLWNHADTEVTQAASRLLTAEAVLVAPNHKPVVLTTRKRQFLACLTRWSPTWNCCTASR